MSDQASRLSHNFLDMIGSEKGKEIFETLNSLLEALETKEDPEMTEVYLVKNLMEFIEKFQVLAHNLTSYSQGETTLLGDKLDRLYESKTKPNIIKQLRR